MQRSTTLAEARGIPRQAGPQYVKPRNKACREQPTAAAGMLNILKPASDRGGSVQAVKMTHLIDNFALNAHDVIHK